MLPASLTELVLLQRKMFEDMDSDGSGEVTREEMRDNLKLLGLNIDDHTTWGLVEEIDSKINIIAPRSPATDHRIDALHSRP